MDRKSSQPLQEKFICQSLVSEPLEISPEEYFEFQRAAKQNAELFITDQCVSAGTPAELIGNLNLQLDGLLKSDVVKSADYEAARVGLAEATRHYAVGGRHQYVLLKYASPSEMEEKKASSRSMTLPTGCIWLLNDLSMEERYATRYTIARRIAQHRREELLSTMRTKALEFETNRAMCNEIRRLIANPKQLELLVSEKKALATVAAASQPGPAVQSVVELNVSSNTTSTKQNAKSRASSSANHSRLHNNSSSKAGSTQQATASDPANVPGFMRPTIASRISTSQSQVQAHSVIASGQSRSSGTTGPANATRNAPTEAAKKPSTGPLKSAFVPVPRTVPSWSSTSTSGKAKSANVSGDLSERQQPLRSAASTNPSAAHSSVPASESLSESVNVASKAHELIEQLFYDDCTASNARSAPFSSAATSVPASASNLAPARGHGKQSSTATGRCDVPKLVNPLPACNTDANGLSFCIFSDQTLNTHGTAPPPVLPIVHPVADKENLCTKAQPDFEIYHDSIAQDDRAPSATVPPATQFPNPSRNTHADLVPLVPQSPAGTAVDFSTTPRLLRGRVGCYDQSVIETPSRHMSVSTFMPPLSSTVINLHMALSDDAVDVDPAPCAPLPTASSTGYNQLTFDEQKTAAPDADWKATRHDEAPRIGLSPHCVTTPQRTDTEACAAPNDIDSGAVAATQSGVNPILGGCGIYEQQLKDTDDDDDVPRRTNFRKPRRSSTTFQRRVVVEMSPIVEVSASTSCSSSNYNASASISHSQSTSRTRSESQSNANFVSDTQTEPDRASQTNNLDEDGSPVSKSHDAQLLKPNIISNCSVSSAFDFLKPYFPKGLTLLDVNANKVGGLVTQDPCSVASQLANLEHCGFLQAVFSGHVNCISLQAQSELPHMLAPQGGIVGALTYDSALPIDNSAFGNCYLLRRRQTDGTSHSEVSVKLLLAHSPDSDVERLRLEGIWEAYILMQVAQRRTQLELQLPHDDATRRFLSGFLQLDHAVLLRNGAALVYRLSDSTPTTLGALLETARSLRANDSTRNATLPFNEALTHLCTIELCEILLTIIRLGLLHTDLRPENLMIRRVIPDVKSSNSLRSGEPLMKLANFGAAVDMHLYGIDYKFGCDVTSRRVGLCPAMLDGCGWSYDLDVYSAARIVQSLIQSSSETFNFEKRGDEWRESVPLKRRWNVKMWENFFRDALRYNQMKTRDETLAKLNELTGILWGAFEQKRAEKLSSLVTDLKCLLDHL